MPSKRMAREYLEHEIREGRGDEPCHIVDIFKEAKKRKENDGPQPKTRFQIELDDPELYCQWNEQKDRIIKRIHNKAIALDFMYRAWRDALADKEIDRMLAEEEGPPT